jgi:hypothetical protein
MLVSNGAPDPDPNAVEAKQYSSSSKALIAMVALIFLGLFVGIVYSFQLPHIMSSLGVVTIVAGASVLIGGLLGFLFGIPRTLQHDYSSSPAEDPAGQPSARETQSVDYRANTNLEQISDWLTKILVGVGLTQITVIPAKLDHVAESIAAGLDGSRGSMIFAEGEILFFAICGFLFGYLWTRLFLAGAFRQADLGAIVNQIKKNSVNFEQVDQKLKDLEKQRELDSIALAMTQRQLNPSRDIPTPTQAELDDAVKKASKPAKIQIFNQAQIMRSENWRTDETKPKMELTIPIFQALVDDDATNVFHRNHGELGFALKDQTRPDWPAAEKELTTAIEVRGPWETTGWLFYEFNRAFCVIMQDENFKQDRASEPASYKRIFDDLRATAHSDLIDLLSRDQQVKRWMSLNNVHIQDLEN